MENHDKTFLIEVAYAQPQYQILEKIKVPIGCTVKQAILLSGILNQFPGIDLTKNQVGIFGKLIKMDAHLHPHDRIEIYRPLIIDPKEARRLRVQSSKKLSTTNKLNSP